MTQTEQLMNDLRDAIRAELITELRGWWSGAAETYTYEGGAADAIEDAVLTLERA